MELTTDQKRAIAESAVIHAAAKLGVGVYKPISDGERYDLILELRPVLLRVQCKWARLSAGVVIVRCYSCRRSASGMVVRPYTADEVDAIAAFCPETDRCYLLSPDVFDGRRRCSCALRRAETISASASTGLTISTSRLD